MTEGFFDGDEFRRAARDWPRAKDEEIEEFLTRNEIDPEKDFVVTLKELPPQVQAHVITGLPTKSYESGEMFKRFVDSAEHIVKGKGDSDTRKAVELERLLYVHRSPFFKDDTSGLLPATFEEVDKFLSDYNVDSTSARLFKELHPKVQ